MVVTYVLHVQVVPPVLPLGHRQGLFQIRDQIRLYCMFCNRAFN
jgi:hypothetical protein